MAGSCLLPLLAFRICLWRRTLKLRFFMFRTFHWFAMDSRELSSISDCFGDQITNKNTKTYTLWLEMIAKVLNMLIGLKGNNYYSKVFKRVNYKLWNSTFWVVINGLSITYEIFSIQQEINEVTDSSDLYLKAPNSFLETSMTVLNANCLKNSWAKSSQVLAVIPPMKRTSAVQHHSMT